MFECMVYCLSSHTQRSDVKQTCQQQGTHWSTEAHEDKYVVDMERHTFNGAHAITSDETQA